MKSKHWLCALLFALCASIAACAPASTPAPISSSPAPTVAPTPAPPASTAATPLANAALPDDEAKNLLYALTGDDTAARENAFQKILAARDTRFVAAFIEVLRAGQIGLVERELAFRAVAALGELTGQSFQDDWASWIEWYGASALQPPPGFTGWKGKILAGIDERFAEFLRDDAPSKIRVEEIQWGGVRVDGIPALENAAMLPAADATFLKPEEPVFGIELNGDARAYPLRILDWHEMANDVIGGVPVSLAYCTLCGAAIAYDGRASNGQTYTFGSSGFLFRSNKLMYDKQTRTLWNQFTGEPVLGVLAQENITLNLLPVVLTSWQNWRTEHPETKVLDWDTGHSRVYEPGAAYGNYFASPELMFPVWQRSKQLPDKARVYGLRVDNVPKAYPLDTLVEKRVVNDAVGQTPVVLIATRGRVTVNGDSIRAGPVQYDAGGEVRAYKRGAEIFSPGSDADSIIDAKGNVWRVTEEALVGPNGARLERVGGHLAYWFGWFAFFPNAQVYMP